MLHLKIFYQMLGNPNLVADGENCLEEVKEIEWEE